MHSLRGENCDSGCDCDLSEEQLRQLTSLAKEISKRAYCPYSKFHVGAAVLAKSGKVYAGCNVENAAYGSTICAERGAIMQMVAGGDRQIAAVVIYTPTQFASPPCGACRQGRPLRGIRVGAYLWSDSWPANIPSSISKRRRATRRGRSSNLTAICSCPPLQGR